VGLNVEQTLADADGVSQIAGKFCAKTTKRQAMDCELPMDPSKKGVY
jgi:hypothetical protein